MLYKEKLFILDLTNKELFFFIISTSEEQPAPALAWVERPARDASVSYEARQHDDAEKDRLCLDMQGSGELLAALFVANHIKRGYGG